MQEERASDSAADVTVTTGIQFVRDADAYAASEIGVEFSGSSDTLLRAFGEQ